MLTDRFDMITDVDWDVKPQHNKYIFEQVAKTLGRLHGLSEPLLFTNVISILFTWAGSNIQVYYINQGNYSKLLQNLLMF